MPWRPGQRHQRCRSPPPFLLRLGLTRNRTRAGRGDLTCCPVSGAAWHRSGRLLPSGPGPRRPRSRRRRTTAARQPRSGRRRLRPRGRWRQADRRKPENGGSQGSGRIGPVSYPVRAELADQPHCLRQLARGAQVPHRPLCRDSTGDRAACALPGSGARPVVVAAAHVGSLHGRRARGTARARLPFQATRCASGAPAGGRAPAPGSGRRSQPSSAPSPGRASLIPTLPPPRMSVIVAALHPQPPFNLSARAGHRHQVRRRPRSQSHSVTTRRET